MNTFRFLHDNGVIFFQPLCSCECKQLSLHQFRLEFCKCQQALWSMCLHFSLNWWQQSTKPLKKIQKTLTTRGAAMNPLLYFLYQILLTTTKWSFIILIPSNEFWTVWTAVAAVQFPLLRDTITVDSNLTCAANYTSTIWTLLNQSEKDGMVFIVICFQKGA